MLPQLPVDKANHVIYGALIALAVLATGQPAEIAALVAIVAGCGKEIADAVRNYLQTGNWKQGPHGVEILDAVATSAGGFCVFLARIL